MTAWTPEWAVEVNGAGDITDLVIADLTVTSGRSDIYSQPVAGYSRFTVKNFDQSAITFDVNDSVVVKVKNSSARIESLSVLLPAIIYPTLSLSC